MKLYDGGLLLVSIIITSLVVGYLSSKWLGDDNPVEECAESFVKEQSGVEIDLTPYSVEESNHHSSLNQ